MSILIENANLYAPEPLGPGSVLIEEDRIAAVCPAQSGACDHSGLRDSAQRVVDLRGAALGPGFIDVHTHGAAGVDLMDGGDAVLQMARFFARRGVTGFVPSTVTASFDAVAQAVDSVRWVMDGPVDGARVLGVHLEGPFISPQRLGAQSPDFCVPPTPGNVARLLDASSGVARIVTLAPEQEGALAAIGNLFERGIVVSIGHSVATAQQAEAAFVAGATQVTHLFNGMPTLHHRQPGIVGAALTARGVRVELIADGVHLAQITLRLALAAKGVDGILLVTDSMAATGQDDGEYLLGPMRVVVRDGQARLPSGALAGSTLTMDRAVLNLAGWTDAGLGGAWQMASLNPARQLGIDHRTGRLVPGHDADLAALDADGRVVMTMVGGRIVDCRP